jgi:hypothetical protein
MASAGGAPNGKNGWCQPAAPLPSLFSLSRVQPCWRPAHSPIPTRAGGWTLGWQVVVSFWNTLAKCSVHLDRVVRGVGVATECQWHAWNASFCACDRSGRVYCTVPLLSHGASCVGDCVSVSFLVCTDASSVARVGQLLNCVCCWASVRCGGCGNHVRRVALRVAWRGVCVHTAQRYTRLGAPGPCWPAAQTNGLCSERE